MTFISLGMIGAFIAVSKAFNPSMNVKPIVTMFGCVALGCFILIFVSGRKKNDE
jgi:hypothetical protein